MIFRDGPLREMKKLGFINFLRLDKAKIIIAIILVVLFFLILIFWVLSVSGNITEVFWLIPMIIGAILTRKGCLPIVGYQCSSWFEAWGGIIVGYLMIFIISYLVACFAVLIRRKIKEDK